MGWNGIQEVNVTWRVKRSEWDGSINQSVRLMKAWKGRENRKETEEREREIKERIDYKNKLDSFLPLV